MTNKKERTAKAAVVFQNDASRIKKKSNTNHSSSIQQQEKP